MMFALEGGGTVCKQRNALSMAMEQYANGDVTAFVIVYQGLAPKLYRYLRNKTRQDASAEDLLQQTLLQIHRMRSRFTPGADVLPWAFAIANRCLIDRVRRENRETRRNSRLELLAVPSAPTVDDLLHVKRMVGSIDERLAALPKGQRDAFSLVTKQGLTLREAAHTLGTTVGAVKARIHRAYTTLRP